MRLLEEVYAGAADVVMIETMEIRSTGQDSYWLCNGFTDQSLYVSELGQYVTFQASNIAVEPMSRDNRLSQTVTFVLDNALGDAQQFIDKAHALGAQIEVYLRMYLSDDKSRQASNTLYATAKEASIQRGQVQISAGFFDSLNTNFNRIMYDSVTAPCIKYL